MEVNRHRGAPTDDRPPGRRLPLLHRAGEVDERHFRLRPLTGEFVDPTIEADFELSRAQQVHQRSDLSAALGATVVLLLGIEDMAAGHDGTWPLHLLIRLLTIAPLLAHVARSRRRSEHRRSDRFPYLAVAVTEAWFLAGLLVHVVLNAHSDSLDLAVFCMAVLIAHLIVPNRMHYLVPLTGLSVVAFEAARFDHTSLSGVERVTGIGLVLVAWASGVYFQRELEVLRREEFIALSNAAGYNERLEQAVARSAELEAELRLQANVDPLTGIGNRRWFFAQLDLEFARSHRTGRPLAVMILDVDHFKVINDTHGHAAGDHVLAHLASVVRSSLRANDLLARIGGEEFAVVMPETPASEAHDVADRVRRSIAANPVLVSSGVIRITASAGVTVCHPVDELPGQALARADANLYDAKRSGRDVVVTR